MRRDRMPNARAYVAYDDLRRSLTACHRVEDELLRRIHPLTVDSKELRRALNAQRDRAPEWCEVKAWNRMIDSMTGWILTYGDLRRWQELRQMKASDL